VLDGGVAALGVRNHARMTDSSASASTGFVTKSFAPASMQRSRSPGTTLPVTAMIGNVCSVSTARIARVV